VFPTIAKTPKVESLQICWHNQVYSSSLQKCEAADAGSITYGEQDTISVPCAQNDDTVHYKRQIGDTLCDYGCSLRQFGLNCESCSDYMTRVGATLESNSIWVDTDNYVCKHFNYHSTCQSARVCHQCSMYDKCTYSGGSCQVDISKSVTPSFDATFDT
jgi:hypothetical protein